MKIKAEEEAAPLRLGSDQAPPEWVKDLVSLHSGESLHFVMEKEIKNSDLNVIQNRLLIPSAFVQANVAPMLREHEKEAANFKKIKNPPDPRKDQEGSSSNNDKKRKVGREHGGLDVELFDRGGRESVRVKLVQWDSARSTVLKGGSGPTDVESGKSNKYLKFMEGNGFGAGDPVEMWAFRKKKEVLSTELSLGWKEALIVEQLCFVLGKKEVTS